jgi:hypothetical protein
MNNKIDSRLFSFKYQFSEAPEKPADQAKTIGDPQPIPPRPQPNQVQRTAQQIQTVAGPLVQVRAIAGVGRIVTIQIVIPDLNRR